MRIAVGLPQIGADVAAAVRAARGAEEAGAWGVWAFDNLSPLVAPDRPVLEGWMLLARLAQETSRVRLVSLVTRAGLRQPAVVSRMTAVVQAASRGRFVLGLGLGDAAGRAEERRFGIRDAGGRAARVRSIEETVARVRGDDLPVSPVAPTSPVWVGGTSDTALSIAARLADAWHGWGLGPEAFAERAARVRAAAGRPIECWWGGMYDPAGDPATLNGLTGAADGVTWMIPSAHDSTRRPALLREIAAAP